MADGWLVVYKETRRWFLFFVETNWKAVLTKKAPWMSLLFTGNKQVRVLCRNLTRVYSSWKLCSRFVLQFGKLGTRRPCPVGWLERRRRRSRQSLVGE